MKSLQVILSAIVLCIGLRNAQAQDWTTNGLALYYPFDGSVQDASGHDIAASTSVCTPAPDRFGNPTNAMAFNGNDSRIVVSSFFSANIPSRVPLTECIWFCPSNSLTTTNLFTLMANANSSDAGYTLSLYDGGNGLQAYDWAYLYSTFSYGPITANTLQTNFAANVWHQIVGVFTSTNVQVYLDGMLQNTTSISAGSFPQSLPDLNIGAQQWSGGAGYRFGFQGRLDDVRIYNRALSETEVEQLYTKESVPVPVVNLVQAVVPTFSNLLAGISYQLQTSTNLNGSFTNYGEPFVATNSIMSYSGYFPINAATALYFRLQVQ